DHIHDPHFQRRQPAAYQPRRRERFLGSDVAGAAHHDVRLPVAIFVAGPSPNRGAASAMLTRVINVQVLRMKLLIDDDQIDVVVAAKAVIRDRQKAISVGGQINAGYDSLLGQYCVYEGGSLMAE